QILRIGCCSHSTFLVGDGNNSGRHMHGELNHEIYEVHEKEMAHEEFLWISRLHHQSANNFFRFSRAAVSRRSSAPLPFHSRRTKSNHSQKLAIFFSATGSARPSRHWCATRGS